MPQTTNSPDSLETRRKRIRYRAWHRGTKEMDLILGRFADAKIENFDVKMLDRLEILMDEQDTDLLAWVFEQIPTPDNVDAELLAQLREYQRSYAIAER